MRTTKPLLLTIALATLIPVNAGAEVPLDWTKPEQPYAFDAVASLFDSILAKDAKAAANMLRFDDSFVYLQQVAPNDLKASKKCKKLVKVKKRKSFKPATTCLFLPEIIRHIEVTQAGPGMLSAMAYYETAEDLIKAEGDAFVTKMAKKHLTALDDQHAFVRIKMADEDNYQWYTIIIAVSSEMNMDERAIGAVFAYGDAIDDIGG